MRRSPTRSLALLAAPILLLAGCAAPAGSGADDSVVLSTARAGESPEAAPEPAPRPPGLDVREDVSRSDAARLQVVQLRPAAPEKAGRGQGDTDPGKAAGPRVVTGDDGARWQVVSSADLRIIRVVIARLDPNRVLVKIKMNEVSGPRFAPVNLAAGRERGTLGLLDADGDLLAALKAPQPLTNGFLQLPAFPTRADADDFVNRVTNSRA